MSLADKSLELRLSQSAGREDSDAKSELAARLQQLICFAIPHTATVVVLNLGGTPSHQFAGYTVRPLFPMEDDRLNDNLLGDDVLRDAGVLMSRLETLRTQGSDFLLLPPVALAFVRKHPQLGRALEQQYRLVLREDIAELFALQEPLDAEWRVRGAPDGLPLPPPELVALVTGMPEVQPFYWSGLLGARCIRGLLNKNGFDMRRFDAILDFGCGCGRVLRHWQTLNGPKLFGTDYNPYLVSWCQSAFPFAEFTVNDLSPPLAYADAQFDLVYTISIFTHLEASLQVAWMTELSRVLKPGGILFLTVHGTTRLASLPLAQQQQFAAGELVVCSPDLSGSNHCTTYHPEAYVREVLARELTVIDFIPGGAKDANQDVFLLQKPRK